MRVRLAVRMMSSDSTSIRFTTPSSSHLPKNSCTSAEKGLLADGIGSSDLGPFQWEFDH